MAQKSLFWTTGTTGDGTSPYTQSDLFTWLRHSFTQDPATEAVHLGWGGALAVSVAGTTLTIATGAALVNGIPFESDAPVNLSVPTPTIGTTGHRVILRADYTAKTVRLALKSSSDGVSTAPALTQSDNVTWEVSLASLTITTGGAVTVTDTRGFLHYRTGVNTAMLDDSSVTSAKLAASVAGNGLAGGAGTPLAVNVDGTSLAITADVLGVKAGGIDVSKLGNLVLALVGRRGGNASDWSVPGAAAYTPGAVRIQVGSVQAAGSGLSGFASVTYPSAFTAKPVVLVMSTSRVVNCGVSSESASGFQVEWQTFDNISATTPTFYWLAIGPTS